MTRNHPLLVAAAALGITPTLQAVGEACGVTRDTLRNVLTAKTKPQPLTVRKVAAALRVSESQALALLTPQSETCPPGTLETSQQVTPETLPSDSEEDLG